VKSRIIEALKPKIISNTIVVDEQGFTVIGTYLSKRINWSDIVGFRELNMPSPLYSRYRMPQNMLFTNDYRVIAIPNFFRLEGAIASRYRAQAIMAHADVEDSNANMYIFSSIINDYASNINPDVSAWICWRLMVLPMSMICFMVPITMYYDIDEYYATIMSFILFILLISIGFIWERYARHIMWGKCKPPFFSATLN